MSINDVNRILHDYRHGSGAYNQQQETTYNSFVISTINYGYSNQPITLTKTPNYYSSTCNTPYNSNGYYYSSSIFT